MSKKILIVDDNSINRKYAKSVLSKAGIEVTVVSSGLEALTTLETEEFQLILLDIQMPQIDGFETLRRIKQQLPAVTCPILAITAFYGDDGKTTFINAGFNDFLRKPIKPDSLIEVAENWLEGKDAKMVEMGSKSGAIIDMDIYNEIKKYAHNADINDLYTEFENETSEFFDKLKFLIPAKNYPEILSTLHTIKGNSGSLGINELALKSEKLETDIRTNQDLDLAYRIGELKDIFNNFKNEYKQLLKI